MNRIVAKQNVADVRHLNQCCGAGAATFRLEPEPIFIWPEPKTGASFFNSAPAASFWQAKKESLELQNMT